MIEQGQGYGWTDLSDSNQLRWEWPWERGALPRVDLRPTAVKLNDLFGK